jgi:hypothetical protein
LNVNSSMWLTLTNLHASTERIIIHECVKWSTNGNWFRLILLISINFYLYTLANILFYFCFITEDFYESKSSFLFHPFPHDICFTTKHNRKTNFYLYFSLWTYSLKCTFSIFHFHIKKLFCAFPPSSSQRNFFLLYVNKIIFSLRVVSQTLLHNVARRDELAISCHENMWYDDKRWEILQETWLQFSAAAVMNRSRWTWCLIIPYPIISTICLHRCLRLGCER